jgi:hypothetical protein
VNNAYTLFLDDSSQDSRRLGLGKVSSIGGILVPQTRLKDLYQGYRNIKQKLGIPENCEIKWAPGKENSPSGYLRKIDPETKKTLQSGLIQVAASTESKVVVSAIDLASSNWDTTTASTNALKFVLERVHNFLEPHSSISAIIIDQPGGAHDQEKSLFSAYKSIKEGTEYVHFTQFAPKSLAFTSSELEPGLQIADLTVGITTAMVVGKYKSSEMPFSEIKPLMLRNSQGQIGAVGLKLYPDSMLNLYYHILGENRHDKKNHTLSISLPLRSLPYSTDV